MDNKPKEQPLPPDSAGDLLAKAPEPPQPASVPEPVKKKSPLLTVILVIFILAVIGGVGAYLYFSQSAKTAAPEIALPPAAPTPVPLFLTVDSPAEDTLVVNGEVLVAGVTLPGTTVSIVTDTDDTIIESDAAGKFETTILMDDAGGLVSITVYGDTGEEKTATFELKGLRS